jgi:hypothetical protein
MHTCTCGCVILTDLQLLILQILAISPFLNRGQRLSQSIGLNLSQTLSLSLSLSLSISEFVLECSLI